MDYTRKVWTKEQCKIFGMALISMRKKFDKLLEKGKITKCRRATLKKRLSYYWDIYYNKRPDIPEGIKQASNSLY